MTQFISAKQISMLYRKSQKYINQQLKSYNVSSSEYSYFMLLSENNNELAQDQLVSLSNLDRAAVTRTIHSLEKKGYITKTPSTKNSRRNIIRLTDLGLEIKEHVIEAVMNWNEKLHQDIDEDQLKTTINTLNIMLMNVEEI